MPVYPSDVEDQPAEPMAAAQWYAICRTESLKHKPLRVRRLGRELVLWRDEGGTARVAGAYCPHRGTDLGLGYVEHGEIVCPLHGFSFNQTGACTRMPCEGPDVRVPGKMRLGMEVVREERGFIWLFYGRAEDAATSEGVPWVPGAPTHLEPGGAGELDWSVRFARVIEGFMDLHHIPFVHRWVFPKTHTRLDPYDVRVEGRVVRTRGILRTDDRSQPGLPVEVSIAYPGMIHIVFDERVQAITLCTPIDGNRTWIAHRYFHKYVSLPGLKQLLSWLLIQTELWVVGPDDLRLLRSAVPRTAGLRTNVHVRSDRGLAEWHKLHAAALAAPRRGEAAS